MHRVIASAQKVRSLSFNFALNRSTQKEISILQDQYIENITNNFKLLYLKDALLLQFIIYKMSYFKMKYTALNSTLNVVLINTCFEFNLHFSFMKLLIRQSRRECGPVS